jgi:hypothetical protein
LEVHVELPSSGGASLGVASGNWGWKTPDFSRRNEALLDGAGVRIRPDPGERDPLMAVTRRPVVGDLSVEAEVTSLTNRAGIVLCTQPAWFFHWAPSVRFGILADKSGAVFLTGAGLNSKPQLPAGSLTMPCRLRVIKEKSLASAEAWIQGEWKQIGVLEGVESECFPGLTSQGEARFGAVQFQNR